VLARELAVWAPAGPVVSGPVVSVLAVWVLAVWVPAVLALAAWGRQRVVEWHSHRPHRRRRR
jgi:hypothetical protein